MRPMLGKVSTQNLTFPKFLTTTFRLVLKKMRFHWEPKVWVYYQASIMVLCYRSLYVLIDWTLFKSSYLHISAAPWLCPCPWCCSLCTGTPPHLSAPPARSWASRCLSAAQTRTALCGYGKPDSVKPAGSAGNRNCEQHGNPPPAAMWQPEVKGQRWSQGWTHSPGWPADLGLRRRDLPAHSL